MDYVIYGDVLVAVNFIIDLLILRLCQPLTGIRQRGLRPYLAAGAGGLCAMAIFFPAGSVCVDLFIRLGVSFIVVSIAYGRQKPVVFLRLLAVFYAVSFLVAGVVMALWFLVPRGRYAYRNGMLYLDLPPVVLIGSVATNVYIYLMPVITLVASALILREPVTLFSVGAIGLIVLGLWLSQRKTEAQT